MKNSFIKFLLALVLVFTTGVSISQNNCPSLGPDQFLPCGVTQTTLNANLSTCLPSTVSPNLTTSYSVTNIPFAPQPTVGAVNVPMTDDSGAGPFPIGFTFCFFGNTYNQFYIGSNGWISFSPGQSTGFVSAPIPNAGFVPKNCIMGPWQDWLPSPGPAYITYQTLGTAPCRKLVVSWNKCPMFSCTTTYGTFQIIIYEATNLIENHLTNKPNCVQWAGGTGVEGIHNLAGNTAVVVPGRNSTQWTAVNDAWRWVPTGAVVTPTLTWYQVGNPVALGTGSTIVVTPAVSGTSYTCKYNYGQCNTGFEVCSAMPGNSPDTVFVKPLTAIIPTITAPTCIGSPTTISCAPSTATNNYVWSGPSILGPNNTPTITIGAAGSYTCMITSTAAACTGSAVVNISQTPTITITPSTNSLCAFNSNNSLNSTSLTASGATTYTWSGFSSLANTYTSVNQPFIYLTPLVPASPVGSVMVTGTNGSCTNTATYTVLIIPNPTISVTSPSVCQGSSIPIVASNASTFTWSPPATLNTSTGATVIATTNTTTVYSIVGSSLGCNSTTENSTVTIVANPTLMITPFTNTICFGGNINLTASGATNYTWSPSSSLNVPNGPIVNASPATTTNYTVIGEKATCTTTAVYQVSVIVLPSIQASVGQPTICQYNSTNITANGAMSYSWSPNVGLSSTTGNQVTASPNVTTVYDIVGNNGACLATGQVTVVVVPFPNLTVSTPNNKICQNQNTTIFANGADHYIWTPTVGLSQTNAPFAQASPLSSINYTINGYNDLNGFVCSSRKEIFIEVVPQVTATVSESVTICNGQTVRFLAGGGPTYTWMPSEGLNNSAIYNPAATPSVSTIYTVDVSYYGNCGATSTVFIRVNPNPTVTAGEDYAMNLDEAMYLNAAGSGTLTWISGDGVLCAACPVTQIMPKTSSCYRIQSINEFGCKAYDEVCVEVTTNYNIYIPNIFTPNGDGVNDEFIVYGTGLSKFEMTIFDRWGEKLYVSNDQLKGWDGTYKGQMSKNDAYPYLIKYHSLDGKTHTKSGHVSLLK